MAIKTEDYERLNDTPLKSYVCEDCRGLWQTFDKAAADAHTKAGIHPYAKGSTEVIET